MDLKKFTESLKMKRLGKNQVLIMFLCGVLLMIIVIPAKEKDTNDESDGLYNLEENDRAMLSESTEYAKFLEYQLEKILSQMEGAGEVACMVTLSQSAEQVIEKDMEASEDVVTESDSHGGTRTTNQSSRAETTIYNGEENGSPYVSKEISPKVEGVLVLAEGGDNALVVKNITEAIQALFGIESHKIRIVKKGVDLK